jgi:hypothetical protein
VLPSTLHRILALEPCLQGLSFIQEVSWSFATEQVPPLVSTSPKIPHYEITSPSTSYGLPPVAASYYRYLISSLKSSCFPAFRDLYVRNSSFPEALLLAPRPRIFGGGEKGPQIPAGGLRSPSMCTAKAWTNWNGILFHMSRLRRAAGEGVRPVRWASPTYD